MPNSDKPKKTAPRFNAVKHGCCSKSPVLPGENEDHWREVQEDWFSEYDLETPIRRALVAEVALAFWQMARNRRRFEQFDASLAHKEACQWNEQDHAVYSRFLRYKTAAERAFHTAFKNVEYFRKVRLSEAEAHHRRELAYDQWQLKITRDLAKLEIEYTRILCQMEEVKQKQADCAAAAPLQEPKKPDFSKLKEFIRQQNEKRSRESQLATPKPPETGPTA